MQPVNPFKNICFWPWWYFYIHSINHPNFFTTSSLSLLVARHRFTLQTQAGKGGSDSLIIGSGESADENACFSLSFPSVSMGFEAASEVRAKLQLLRHYCSTWLSTLFNNSAVFKGDILKKQMLYARV